MKKFDKIILKYIDIITEQDLVGNTPEPQEPDQAQPSQPSQPAQPQQPVQNPPQNKIASSGFTSIVKLILSAFKTLKPYYHGDIRFSDNTAQNAQEAYKYLEIVKRNLPKNMQTTVFNNLGGRGGMKDLDENELIEAANLALKALFYQPKSQDSTEYNFIFDIDEVTPETAITTYHKIRNFFSGIEK